MVPPLVVPEPKLPVLAEPVLPVGSVLPELDPEPLVVPPLVAEPLVVPPLVAPVVPLPEAPLAPRVPGDEPLQAAR